MRNDSTLVSFDTLLTSLALRSSIEVPYARISSRYYQRQGAVMSVDVEPMFCIRADRNLYHRI